MGSELACDARHEKKRNISINGSLTKEGNIINTKELELVWNARQRATRKFSKEKKRKKYQKHLGNSILLVTIILFSCF